MVKNNILKDKPEFICASLVDTSHIIPHPLCSVPKAALEDVQKQSLHTL
jgi:hypothetical protein